MPEETDFLRAVAAHPDANVPRLAYADWLAERGGTVACLGCEEGKVWVDAPMYHYEGIFPGRKKVPHAACNGTGHVSDGSHERAKLIRVQCGLAAMPRRHVVAEPAAVTTHGDNYFSIADGARTHCGGMMALVAKPGDRVDVPYPVSSKKGRRRPLLGLRLVKFTGDPTRLAVLARDDKSGPDASEELRRRERELLERYWWQWDSNGLGLHHVLQHPVECANLTGTADAAGFVQAVVTFCRGFVDEIALPCAALVAHAAELGRACPGLQTVRVTDREPLDDGPSVPFRECCWYDEAQYGPSLAGDTSDLPTVLFGMLPEEGAVNRGDGSVDYGTPEAALAALAAAALALVRARGGWLVKEVADATA